MVIEVWHDANSNTPPLPLVRVRFSNRHPLTVTIVAYLDNEEEYRHNTGLDAHLKVEMFVDVQLNANVAAGLMSE